MAARNDLEVAVTDGKTVGIVENLAVGAVALGEIYRIFVFPVVVVLVDGDRAGTAWGEVEGGVAEVVVVADRLLQERGDEGGIDEPVADGATVVPGADEIGLGLRVGWFAQGIEVLADIGEVENFCDCRRQTEFMGGPDKAWGERRATMSEDKEVIDNV